MVDLAERVWESVSRSKLIPAQARVGVAVSSGGDSVCLLHLLHRLAERAGWALTVLHVDHGLRGAESDADARFVEQLAGDFGLPYESRRCVPPGAGNLEQAARDLRRAFYWELRQAGRLDLIALGHTRDDQAETVLFRFLRGAGTRGLAGMQRISADGLVRPLLEYSRDELRGYLRTAGLAWREDSTNSDERFRRNRLRHSLIPQLTQEWNPALTGALLQTARLAREEEDYWQAAVERVAAEHLTVSAGAALLPVGALRQLPLPLARRLLRHVFELVRGDLRQITFEHIEQGLQLVAAPDGSGRFQVPGLDIYRSFDWLRIAVPTPGSGTSRFHEVPIHGAGLYTVPGSEYRIQVARVARTAEGAESHYNEKIADLDADRVRGPLVLEGWRPGDILHVAGAAGPKKLKTLFQEARIPLWERRFWPMIKEDGQVVWAWQFGVSAERAAGPGTREVWRVSVPPQSSRT